MSVQKAYQVTVAGLQSLVDGVADLTRGGLPCAKAQLAVPLSVYVVTDVLIFGNTYGIFAPVLRVTVLPL